MPLPRSIPTNTNACNGPGYAENSTVSGRSLQQRRMAAARSAGTWPVRADENTNQKFLALCHHTDTALALGEYSSLRGGICATTFHEGLTLIERDRAAAWFADLECGAQNTGVLGNRAAKVAISSFVTTLSCSWICRCPLMCVKQRIGRSLIVLGKNRISRFTKIRVRRQSASAAVPAGIRKVSTVFCKSRLLSPVAYDEFYGDLR